jgi:putative DNA primase/helicase
MRVLGKTSWWIHHEKFPCKAAKEEAAASLCLVVFGQKNHKCVGTEQVQAVNTVPAQNLIKPTKLGNRRKIKMANVFKLRKVSAQCNTPKKLELRGFPHQPDGQSVKPKVTIENVEHLLNSYCITARYNVISKRVEVKSLTAQTNQVPNEVTGTDGEVAQVKKSANEDNVAITRVISLASLNNMSTSHIPEMIEAVGVNYEYNPAKEWIESLPWDGQDRLQAYYGTLETVTGYSIELKETLMYKWLLSATAAAIIQNGFYTRGVLTLQGAQNKGKTNWVRSLVNDPVLQTELIKIDHQLDANNKDSILGAASYWLVELGELDSSFKKDIARIKGFLSSDRDRVRRPYARLESDYARRTVFCATVNEPTFLVDPTGNTRWWTLEVEKINFNHGIDTQQLFAQLAVDLSKGAQWWLTDDENEMLEQCNQKYRAVSKIRDKINEYVDTTVTPSREHQSFTATSLLEHVGIKSPTNSECKECGSILRDIFGIDYFRPGMKAWRVPIIKGKSIDLNEPDQYLEHLMDDKEDQKPHLKDGDDQWDDLPF